MPRRYYLLLVLIVLAGAFLRLSRLNDVPPGLHYDLAATALLGNEVAFNGYRPLFITAYTGHEALYYYWLALWFKLIGSSVFALRLAAATLGILAIPAGFFALRETLRGDGESGLPAAALGAVFLATAFFHVVFSRFGFRVISEPVVQALAVGFLVRGAWSLVHEAGIASTKDERRRTKAAQFVYRPSSFVWFALAGLFTGLAAYTYLAARLLPVPLAVFWAVLLWGAWRQDRRRGMSFRTAPVLRGEESVPPAASQSTDFSGPTPPVEMTSSGAKDDPSRSSDLRHLPHSISWGSSFVLRPTLTAFGVYTLSALLAFLPLGLYFLRHPDDFLNRAGQVTPRAGEGALLLTGLRRALEMVFLNGEPYDRFNIPGLPLFGPVVGFFFVIGLLVTLRSAWRASRAAGGRVSEHARSSAPLPPNRIRLAAELMLLAWLPAFLLPTALAVHDIFPSNVRAFGLIPLLFAFPARGLLACYRFVQRLWPGPLIPYAYPLAVVTVIALAGTFYATGRNYFDVWARLPAQPQNNDADLTLIAGYLNASDLSGTSIYVSAIHYRHPTLAYLARDFDQINWLTGGTSIALPAQGPALYLFARSASPPDEWIAAWAPYLDAAPLDPDGVPIFRAYAFPAGAAPPLPAFSPLNENFANVITLAGYNIVTSADHLLVDLRWTVENLPDAGDYLPYARLTDSAGAVWAQSGGFSYPSEQWQPGDTLLTRLAVPLPAGLPPGGYVLRVGVFSAGQQASLPHLDANGGFAGERAALPPIRLPGTMQAGLDALLAENTITAPLANTGLDAAPALLGYSLNTPSPRQGERLLLTLFWQAHQTPPAAAQTLSIALGASTLYSGPAARGALPLSTLPPGSVLVDRYEVFVPADQPAAPTELSVLVPGLGAATLAALDVQAVDRRYDPLPFDVPLTASFAPAGQPALFALRGYTFAPVAAGQPATITLVYQGETGTPVDYTAFVHVLDAAGALVAQRDGAPQSGAYPTHLWQPGEYVPDEYAFDLPPGAYTFRFGFYHPETGQRLIVAETGADAVVVGPVGAP